MSLFVTGTDTEIGKTVVSALVAARYDATYWKPVASGSDDGRDADTVRELAGVESLDEAYSFRWPASPHFAARLENAQIELDAILDAWRRHRNEHERLVVEGVGGLLVPLDAKGTRSTLVADLIAELGLPSLVVARSGLGTLNHTLLTLAEMKRRGLEVAGVVMCQATDEPGDPAIADDNRRTLQDVAEVELIEAIELLQPLDAPTLQTRARRFDRGGHLRRYFAG